MTRGSVRSSLFAGVTLVLLVATLPRGGPALAPRAAHAQEGPSERRARYRALIFAGVSAAAEPTRLEEALASFRAAHRIRPGARTARAIGHLELARGNAQEAARWLTLSLRHRRDRLDATLRAEVEARLAELARGLSELRVILTRAGSVSLDGAPLSASATQFLPAGDHRLVVRWADGERAEYPLALRAGSSLVAVVRPGPARWVRVDADVAPGGLLLVDEHVVPTAATFLVSAGAATLGVRWSGSGAYERRETTLVGARVRVRWTPGEFAMEGSP